MWLAGAIGVAAGLGQWLVGLTATLIGLIVIVVLGKLENHDWPSGDVPLVYETMYPVNVVGGKKPLNQLVISAWHGQPQDRSIAVRLRSEPPP